MGKATQDLADYLNTRFDVPPVGISRDSHRVGEGFVRRAAEVLAARGIKAYFYPRAEPTSALSFAVRDLGCSAGIRVTASRNPVPYSGYKVYDVHDRQITARVANACCAPAGTLLR